MIFTAFSKFIKEEERDSFDICIKDIKVVTEFYPELKHKDICIYFYARDYIPRGKFSRFFPLHHPAYYPKIKNIRSLAEFSIIFPKKFCTLEEIDRYLIITHEFQHIVQYIKSRKEYLYSCILRDHGKDGTGFIDQKIPTEIDADRKAKRILTEVFGPNKVEKFINKFSSNSDMRFQIYAEYFRLFNLDEEYDFRNEAIKMWEENSMDKVIEKLRTHPIKIYKRVIENYDLANEL